MTAATTPTFETGRVPDVLSLLYFVDAFKFRAGLRGGTRSWTLRRKRHLSAAKVIGSGAKKKATEWTGIRNNVGHF